MTIHCEFRLICSSNKDADRYLARIPMPAVPDKGETININGNPFIVYERGWAVGSRAKDTIENGLFCYIRVTKTFPYNIEDMPGYNDLEKP